MNLKSTYFLFGALIVLLGTFAVITRVLRLERPGSDSPQLLPALTKGTPAQPRSFDTVEVAVRQPQASKLVFIRQPQGWKMTQPYELRADPDVVDRLIRQIVDAKKAKADLTTNLSEYDLDPPAATVTLKRGSDESWSINLGKTSPGGDNAVVYATSSADPRTPVAIKRSDIDLFFKEAKDFLPLNPLYASALNTSAVELQHDKQVLAVARNESGIWNFVKPAGYGPADFDGDNTPTDVVPRPITGVKDLLETVGQLQMKKLDGYVTLSADDAQLAKYGLAADSPATLRIAIKRTAERLIGGSDEPVTLTLLIGNKIGDEKKPDEKKPDEKKPDDPHGEEERGPWYLARMDGERAVLKVPARPVESLLKILATPEKLRDRDLLRLTEAQVDAIDVQNGDVKIELRKTGRPRVWKLVAGLSQPFTADVGLMNDTIHRLSERRLIRQFPPDKPDAEYGLDKPASIVSVWQDGIEPPAGEEDPKKPAPIKLKSDKPTARLLFGKKEGDLVYVKREQGGSSLVAQVPADLLDTMLEGPLAYVERNLLSFDELNVVKLVVQRPDETIGVAQDPETKMWKFTEPKELAGQTADERSVIQLIHEINQLRADRFLSDKAGDAKMYGLEPPAYRVTVSLKKNDKPEERVYLLSKESDKGRLNLKQAERDLIAEVTKLQTRLIQHGSLQDTRIFAFDPAKVKEVTLAGFKTPGGADTLQLEQKAPKEWQAVKPEKFTLDPLQVIGFVDGLANLRAKEFVPAKSAPKEGFQLGAKERSLLITIAFLDPKEASLTLTIGGLDKERMGYFASAGAKPKQVFLVDAVRFEQLLKKGAAYFGKAE